MFYDDRKQLIVIVCHISLNALEIVYASILVFLLFVSYHWYAFRIKDMIQRAHQRWV